MAVKECLKCKRERLIHAHNLCGSCYATENRKKNDPSGEKHIERMRRWRERNRHYWKKYHENNREKMNANQVRYYHRKKKENENNAEETDV